MRILKESHSAEKRKKGPFGFFIIQLVAKKIEITSGDPLATSNIFGKNLTMPKKVEQNQLSCPDKALKNMIAKSVTLWKHPRLIFNKAGNPKEIL